MHLNNSWGTSDVTHSYKCTRLLHYPKTLYQFQTFCCLWCWCWKVLVVRLNHKLSYLYSGGRLSQPLQRESTLRSGEILSSSICQTKSIIRHYVKKKNLTLLLKNLLTLKQRRKMSEHHKSHKTWWIPPQILFLRIKYTMLPSLCNLFRKFLDIISKGC